MGGSQGRVAGRLQWLAMGLLAVGLAGLPLGPLLPRLVLALGALTALKLLEARRLGERRLVGLLQLLSAGLLAALQPELGPSLLQGLATAFALAGLLALELGEGLAGRDLLRRSAAVLAAALPMALVLLLLLPRLGPFAVLPGVQGGGAVTGLSERLDPGGIAALAASTAPAARVVFERGVPPPPPERYWRVLVHGRFDGRRWLASPPGAVARATEAAPGAPAAPAAGGLQLWLAEPSGLAAVPWSGRGRPLGSDLRLAASGELQHRAPGDQRRLYAVREEMRAEASEVGSYAGASAWQRQPPAAADLELPRGQNPRLEALAADWVQQFPATGPKATATRLAAAERWFRRQPFRYTMQPGTLPLRAPLDAFLFERREGFCGHFASAFTALMRAADVPARVVSGYRGGAWVQPLGGTGYLELRQADAHAWSEVWLAGEGWRRVDPTAWVPAGAEARGRERLAAGPLLWLQRQWWGLDLAWSRLWLGFDRQGQAELLRRLLGERQTWAGALALGATALALAVGVAALAWLRQRRSAAAADPVRRELDRALKSFAARGMAPQTGETLPVFAARLERRWPALANELASFVGLYQWQRFTAPAALETGNGAGKPEATGPGELARELGRRRRRLQGRLRQVAAAERQGRPGRGTKEGPLR